MRRCSRIWGIVLLQIFIFLIASSQDQMSLEVPFYFSVSSVPGAIDTLYLGIHGDGPNPPGIIMDNTYGPDVGSEYGRWREYSFPPDPQIFNFFAKFIQIPSRTGLLPPEGILPTGLKPKDFRGYTQYSQTDTFQIQVYGDPISHKVGEGQITISWNTGPYFCAFQTWQLQKKNPDGIFRIEVPSMCTTSSWIDSNALHENIVQYLIIRNPVNPLQTRLNLNAGWNLVSVPSEQADYTPSVIFPGVFGDMFKFEGGVYATAFPLAPGIGYWAYYTAAVNIYIVGPARPATTINLSAGWNIIGSREVTTNTSTLTTNPASQLFGDIFSYSAGGYMTTTTIAPGQGVWVYSLSDCTLIIP